MSGRVARPWLMVAAFLLPATAAAQQPVGPIQDNSFLIEEAYNQEAGVVQHISFFNHAWGEGEWRYTFTQEWPLTGQRHQVSYALLLQRGGAAGTRSTGLGDLALNYRYQLVGDGDHALAVAPRVTLLLPTGDEASGLGAGGVGVQVNLPASWVIARRLTAHWNAGATVTPSARDAAGNRAGTSGLNLGQSVIWLVAPTVNLMLETAWTRDEAVAGPGRTLETESFFVSPGIRWALNLPSGLQVVPGVAIPFGVGPSRGDRSVVLYLSFEHPFR
ncbi:MAG: transporter [Gemmatimonadetes bacterium]|nr:transporter [Gemmatimonadota bacterium]